MRKVQKNSKPSKNRKDPKVDPKDVKVNFLEVMLKRDEEKE